MVILGFMLNYALRVNLTIAIVAMVDEPKGTSTAHNHTSLTSPLTINDTYTYKTHANEELTSASHTLLTTATPEPFQNTTDKVSTQQFSFLLLSFYLFQSKQNLFFKHKKE